MGAAAVRSAGLPPLRRPGPVRLDPPAELFADRFAEWMRAKFGNPHWPFDPPVGSGVE